MKEVIKDDFQNQCGIFYCITKKNCEEIADFLVKCGFSATYCHGDLDKKERKLRQAKWMSGEVKVCLCSYSKS